ncbi:MAG: hypothetical protein ACR2JE_15195 [Acidobacteriaceae bacterium]
MAYRMCSRGAIIAAMATGTLLLPIVGCKSGKKQPNDKNFTTALNTYYSNHNDCLYSQALKFPYEVPSTDKSDKGPKAMDALTAAGLLTRDEDKSIKVKRYALTPIGTRATGRFCYGHREVTQVDGFTEPATVGGHLQSAVSYHYKMLDVPVWANTDEMKHAFPLLAKALSDQAEGKTTLMRTLDDWEVPE